MKRRDKVITLAFFAALSCGLVSALGLGIGGPRFGLTVAGLVGMNACGLFMFGAIAYDVIKS